VRDYLAEVVAQARATGYTETLLGRRRYLPDLTSDNRQRREMAERAALNAPIQGSAADIIKVAMIEVAQAFTGVGLSSRMLLQVPDGRVLEGAPGEREQVESILREHMGGAAGLSVPLDVSVGVGENWRIAGHERKGGTCEPNISYRRCSFPCCSGVARTRAASMLMVKPSPARKSRATNSRPTRRSH